MITRWCTWCGEEFVPIEGASTSLDEPVFCSADHEAQASMADGDWDAYQEARYGSAPVYP